MLTQSTLTIHQVEAFYHDHFVDDQIRHFAESFDSETKFSRVVDVGGGCGYFARQLQNTERYTVTVLDMDQASIEACHAAGVLAKLSNALSPIFTGEEDIVCFNLILHHLVGSTEDSTLELQKKALTVWHSKAKAVFVNEYIYESYIGNAAGWLIYQITKNLILSTAARAVSKFIPSLRANTFGVGVRFRSHKEWNHIFEAAGYKVRSTIYGQEEVVSFARRLLLIKRIRRDSFVLVPKLLKAF
jgi:hypothetical protein